MQWGELSSEAIISHCLENAPRNRLFRHPLFRRLYLVFFVFFTLIVLLPLWTIIYTPRSNRPRQSWTLQRCLRVRWSRRLCALVARCEIDYLGRDLNLDIDPLKLSHSHPITIPPAPDKYLLGHPAKTVAQLKHNNWRPHLIDARDTWGRWEKDQCPSLNFIPVKAFWFTGIKETPEDILKPRNPEDPVMLHFHGGGYLCGTAAETDLTSSIPKALVVHSAIHHILSIDYRLAPVAPWPLPLLDAISAYRYLVEEEGAEDIVIAGDSAGGHLALALTRWVRDEGYKVGLRQPKALVLMSPWCDIGFSHNWGDEGYSFNADSDTIDDTFGPFATSLLLRGLPPHIMHTSEYLSPASLLLKDTETFEQFPPTFIVYGGAERLGPSIETLYDRLKGSRQGNDVLWSVPDSVHDFMIFPWQAEEAAGVYERLDEWIREVLADQDTDEVEEKEVWVQTIAERRRKRRASLKLEKSPLMRPIRKDSNVFGMIGDFQGEGMSMVDITPLDLDLSAGVAKEWLTPFTAQQEKGDWDWDGTWYDEPDSE